MDIRSSEEIFGGRLLREVDESEESLESVCRIFSLICLSITNVPPSFPFHFLATKFTHEIDADR